MHTSRPDSPFLPHTSTKLCILIYSNACDHKSNEMHLQGNNSELGRDKFMERRPNLE